MALRKELLRQHYLDQFFGSFAFRAKLSAFVVFWTAGWLPIAARLGRRQDSVKPDSGNYTNNECGSSQRATLK